MISKISYSDNIHLIQAANITRHSSRIPSENEVSETPNDLATRMLKETMENPGQVLKLLGSNIDIYA